MVESNLVDKKELEHKQVWDSEIERKLKFVSAPAQIISVPPWSLAAELELEVGDKIVSINGKKFRDIMDFNFELAQSEEVELIVRRNSEDFAIEFSKDFDEELGAEFATPLFNGVQECANDCPFCFIDNQPYDGTRESLHLKDDDFRLSYLHGSYVTLTNLSTSDRRRIETLRPGPLYISVHASDPEVRNLMLGRKKSIPIMQELAWLSSLDIPVHTQIVLCPEMNDGKHLLKTIEDLFGAKDSPVVSVAIVPVGLTKYHSRGLRRFTMDEAFEVINLVENWENQDPKNRKNFVFLSDEFYLMTHSPIPQQNYYGDYPQLEDGVGMTRLFLNEIEKELNKLPKEKPNLSKEPKTISWVNGTIAKPILNEVAKRINNKFKNIKLKAICLDSLFWGTTNVSGLLTGNDIYENLKYLSPDTLGSALIIPKVMLKDGSDIFLDDMHISELENKLGVKCIKAWGAEELIQVIHKLSS